MVPFPLPERAVPVLAVATDEWPRVPTTPGEMKGEWRFLPVHATEEVRGQVFRLLRSPDTGFPARAGARFVVVPWTYGPGCAEEGWTEEGWVPAGDTVVFLLTPTRTGADEPESSYSPAAGRGPAEGAEPPESSHSPAAGRGSAGGGDPPVFDVLGWEQPYPVAPVLAFRRRVSGGTTPWLTAREYYELLVRLPGEHAYRARPRAAVRPLLRWLEEHPDLHDAFPVTELVTEMEEMEEMERMEKTGSVTR